MYRFLPFIINGSLWPALWIGLFLGLVILMLLLALRKYEMRRLKDHLEMRRLLELNELKTKLYNNISYEFRNPLTLILGTAGNFQENDHARNLITRNAKTLLHLIDQMQDLLNLEEGNVSPTLYQSDLIRSVNYLTESFSAMSRERDISFSVYSEEASLIMDFDEPKMQQVIMALLSNAFRSTQNGGEVDVYIRKVEINGQPHVQLNVKDSGIGISPENLPNIFDPLHLVDNWPRLTGTLTDIGIPLVKGLVELMEGNISVSSIPGKGSEFSVVLPIFNNAPFPSIEISPKDPDYFPPIAYSSDPGEMAGLSTLKPDLHKPLLLIVEDNPDVIFYIFSIVKQEYRVESASDGRIGLDKAIELVPDLIITDIMMPHLDGLSMIDKLKEDERTSHIPIVIVTAKASTEDRIAGLCRGSDVYLTKPFNREELLVVIKKLLATRRILQLRYSKLSLEGKMPFPSPAEMEKEENFIIQLRNFLEENLSNGDLKLEDICKEMGMGRTNLNKKLNALTDQSVMQLFASIRLQKARQLLEGTSLSVSEIAFMVGFNDPKYFSRAFSKEFGRAPKRWNLEK